MKKFFALCLFLSLHLMADTTGEAAVESAEIAQANNWQNWTFTAIAIVVAAGAVYFVSTDNGHPAN